MKVFVTGGSGYIGRATIAALRRGGHEVTALVRGEQAAQAVASLGAAPVTGTFGDLGVLRDAAVSADGVIHLAQARGPQAGQIDREAAAAMQDGASATPYVHTGGTWIYGNTAGLVTEDAPPAPPPVVAWRLGNEKQVLARAASGGRPVVVMPGIVYGKAAGLIRQFLVESARDRQVVHYIDGGANNWSPVHVDDIADAFALDQRIDSARARRKPGWNPPARDVLAEIAMPAEAAAPRPGQ